MSQLLFADDTKGATFSPCRTWRYELWRRWGREPERYCAFIGLNPSTADETNDDPTIRRCIGFAKRWGFSGLYMLNLFAFRSTDPTGLKTANDPVGPENNLHLMRICDSAELVIAAWGVHGTYLDRHKKVLSLLGPLHCLGTTKDGHPKHPLYLAGDTEPVLFNRGSPTNAERRSK